MCGDMNNDQQIIIVDGQVYIIFILNGSVQVNFCKDIIVDGIILVWDVGFMVNCDFNFNIINNCNYFIFVINLNQLVNLGYVSVNIVQGYVDVLIMNLNVWLIGYEFNVFGFIIVDVVNLVDLL